MKDDVKKYMSEIGKKGGASGRGASKRRGPDHYRKMVAARKKHGPDQVPSPETS